MARKNLGWMNGQYIHEGKLYTPQQIEAMFPINYPLIDANDRTALKGENKCKKGNFIHNQKSY